MTESTDDLLQRFRAAVPEGEGSACPPAEDFWAAAAGELPFERVRTLSDHSARCAQCAEAWRILGEVRRESADPPAEAASTLRRLPARRRSPVSVFVPLAIPALAAVAIFVAVRQEPQRPAPVERGNGAVAMRALSPDLQPAREAVLRWSEVPGATSYNVTVLTPDLVVVHQAVGVSAREIQLPEAVGRRAAGGGLLWNVDAVLTDGRTVASPTFEVRLK